MRSLISFLIVGPLICLSAIATEKPNILFILSDDQGFDALSCTGAKKIATPNIDRICKEGMRFTDFYVHNRCSPTRLAFMTGSDANRAGYAKVIYRHSQIGINDAEITTPELLRKGGYATGMVGKWHLGEFEQFNPVHHGFDSFYGFMTYEGKSQGIFRNTELIEKIGGKTDGIHSEKLLKAGLDFIESNREGPFFLYYASPIPHVRWKPNSRFEGSSEQGTYGDVMQELDWQVGGLLNKLDELDLAGNTLVIYASDNGPQLGIGGEEKSGIYRDGKWTNFEGGIRVPCFMRWPARIAAGSVNREIAAVYDLLPTFSELAGVSVPSDRVIDGRSLVAYLGEDPPKEPLRESFLVSGSTYRYQQWKYIHRPITPGGQERYWGDRVPVAAGALFNLEDDPGEQTNVAAQHPGVVKMLTGRMLEEMKELERHSREIGKTPDFSEEKTKERKKEK